MTFSEAVALWLAHRGQMCELSLTAASSLRAHRQVAGVLSDHLGHHPLADLRKSARLDLDDRTEGLIRSLKRSGAEYSEVFIRGPECQAIGRLVLDRYSATVFSSSPDTYAAIERRLAAGETIAEAIEAVASGGQPSPATNRETAHG